MTTTESTAGMEVRTEVVDGRDVEYLVAGSGPPLVLLHGDGESARDWQWVMPALSAAHQVYSLSLPGHGGTAPTESYTPQSLAAWVTSVLDALNLPRVSLAGNSIGALVALHVTLDHAARVERLVLLDSAGLGRAVNPILAMETAAGIGEAAIGTALLPGGAQLRAAARAPVLFAQPWRAPAQWWTDQVRWGSQRTFLEAAIAAKRAILDIGGQRHVVLDRLGEVQVPTLVLWGALDQVLPYTQGRAAAGRLSHGRLQLVHDAGHLVHIERPDAVSAAMLTFLAEGTAA
jgi:pimeloyl-ACP methyl ester carboxylesterase